MDTTSFAATKLSIPVPVWPAINQPHLLELLDQPSYRVGLVSAPAGFGKTTLLAAWAAGRGDGVAWLSCDVADSEPTRFWHGLLAGVGARWPGVGDDAALLLERLGLDSHELAISLANDLGALARPVAIVIDDFHLAAPSADVFTAFVGALPASVRLVLGSRVDPLLPLGRLRVSGALLELRVDDLCLSATETTAVLAANHLALDPGGAGRIHGLTEGWAAGVQLAALALQREPDRAGFLDAFASTDRAVADFLVGEVLDRQPAELVDFLLATAVLEQFDVALCEAVAGQEHTARLLAQLVAANLFVVRLDANGVWYRYHHLFGAFLRARLRATGLARWRAAHERAARALEERGDIVGAFNHATAVGDREEAARIVRRTLARWINVVDPDATIATARHWLNRHGRDLIATDPVQVLDYLLPLVATNSAEDAVWWFEQIDAAHPDPSPTLRAYLQGVWGEYHQCRGEAEAALVRNRTALEALGGRPPAEGAVAAAVVALCRAHLLADDRVCAEQVLDRAGGQHTGHPVVDNVHVPALRAWVAYLRGELRLAGERAGAALAVADGLDLPPNEPGRIFATLTVACLDVERGDDDLARQRLEQLRHDVDVSRRPPLQALVALQQARHARIVGDEASAEGQLTIARLLLPHAGPSVRRVFGAEAARQAMVFRPSVAGDLVDALGEGPTHTLLSAQLALGAGDPRRAGGHLAELPPPGTRRERIVASLLRAMVVVDRDVEEANTHLDVALPAAHDEGFRRTILGQGPDVVKLLMSYAPTAAVEPYVDELLHAASSAAAPARPGVVTRLVDPLSERETTVLRYLCSRLTYQEIASALYVSHNTLKSHVSSVYRKLAVGSRREAVDVGRQLRIV